MHSILYLIERIIVKLLHSIDNLEILTILKKHFVAIYIGAVMSKVPYASDISNFKSKQFGETAIIA